MPVKIALSGSCYWCLQAVLDYMQGISNTRIGWYQTVSGRFEVVTADWDPQHLPLEKLLNVHLKLFCRGSAHALRSRYPHGIYFDNPESITAAQTLLAKLPDSSHLKPAATSELLAAEERYQHLFLRHPGLPFCRRVIAPKMEMFLREFAPLASNHAP